MEGNGAFQIPGTSNYESEQVMTAIYTREAAAQQARLDKANRAPVALPTCCESNGFFGAEGCGQGRNCPEHRIQFAGSEPASADWFCAWRSDMASAGKLVLACVLFVAVVALAAWFVSSAIDAVSPYWPVAVAALGV